MRDTIKVGAVKGFHPICVRIVSKHKESFPRSTPDPFMQLYVRNHVNYFDLI